ncbi:MAG TPA: 30S ribosomal protein S17e [archaeon]|nr:30S ribosomal protein S17e [archaeon]
MGKAVPQNIKSRANVLIQAFPENFSDNFEKNKDFINSLGMPLSKLQRNLVAGFIVRIKERLNA